MHSSGKIIVPLFYRDVSSCMYECDCVLIFLYISPVGYFSRSKLHLPKGQLIRL